MSSRAEVLTLDPTAELITDNINVEDRQFQVRLNISEASMARTLQENA